MAKTSATPWGAATVVDQLTVQQRAGEKRFASVVQLLEADLERLHAELAKHPELAATLGFGVSNGGGA
jgi:hypothetical protein